MSEKYEELAREYCIAAVGRADFASSMQWIADAFRWLDERRSKDVCEWKDGEPTCQEAKDSVPDMLFGDRCEWCGRQIKEVR